MHRADKVRKIFFLLRCLSPVAWQHGRTPLWYAAFNGRDLIVAALYARGASLDKVAILQRSETLTLILRLQISFQENITVCRECEVPQNAATDASVSGI